ncbi:MAG: hypothetical protein SGPRY_004155, partial [Prymnesium sp.]
MSALSAKPELLTPSLPAETPPWEVHKFGGASLATAALYVQCSDLLKAESASSVGEGGRYKPTMAIVSAKGGVTDKLIAVVSAARDDIEEAERLLRVVANEQIEVTREIASEEVAARVEAAVRADEKDILMVIRSPSISSNPDCPPWYGLYVQVGVEPLWQPSSERVNSWWESQKELLELDYSKGAPIVVVTGFVAATVEGTPTTLKRSGSDYSATIFARLMGASRITMWKNVDGVYTADPRRVPEAFPIESLKYDEAIELAYFGAQATPLPACPLSAVLHPSAMMPCIEGNIPIYVRNVFNPSHPGTVIEGRACSMSDGALTWAEQ